MCDCQTCQEEALEEIRLELAAASLADAPPPSTASCTGGEDATKPA